MLTKDLPRRTLDASTGPAEISRRVVRSAATNYAGKFVSLGTAFVLTPFILHQLGSTIYGLWALAGSVTGYGALLDIGITNAIVKYTAEYRARGQLAAARSVIATALWLYSALAVLAVALSAIVAPLLARLLAVPTEERETATWLIFLGGVGMGLSLPCNVTGAVLRGLQRFDLLNLARIGGALASALATVAVLLLGGGVVGLQLVYIGLMLAMQVPTIWLVRRAAPELHLGWRGATRQLVRPIVSFGGPVFAVDAAARVQNKTDELVIGVFLPVAAVTPYALAHRLSEVGQILADQFLKLLLPMASQLHAEDARDDLRSLYLTSTRLTLAVLAPVAGMLVLLGGPLLGAWVGAEYARYGYLVAILVVASLVETSVWPAGSILQGVGRHRPQALMAVASALTNLVLSVVLVQRLGLLGVAVGTLIPTIAECLGLVLPYAMRVTGVSLSEMARQVWLPTLLPTIPMLGVTTALARMVGDWSLATIALVGTAGLGIYAIGYLSLGRRERRAGNV